MLPQVAAKSWYHSYDAFRSVPKDLSEASQSGAIMTVVAALICVVLFMCEATAFLTSKPSTRIVIDSNEDPSLRINFDVHMLDVACDYVTVGLWDAFGTEKMNVTRNVLKQRIDHKGARDGHPYTEDEIAELEFNTQAFSKDELAELDSDWGSSSDNFKHNDFKAVITAHDFVMINFYADWCGHCRQFAPTWLDFEKKVNDGQETLLDADKVQANVRLLRINCVDFEETCMEQRIRMFPSVRLYRRAAKEGHFDDFRGPLSIDGLRGFLVREVAKRHTHTGATYHSMFNEGCRITGHIEAARVPGTLHFQAQNSADRMFNPSFTNVSHTVHHLSFGEAPRRSIFSLPSEYKRHVNPLDGRTFVADKFHKAPHHFIKVVHTRFEETGLRSYQQTHQWSLRMLQRNTIPQAKFSYDLSPVEVVVSKGERRWYDFVTQVFAIIGGAFSVMSMAMGVLKISQVQLKTMMNKMG
mmetsp:Transcript_126125/g.315204  ORF Transcript_126125/g.315204 Transcript_126125/m.315204 type:complete len:469 (-) Transcript_126125:132-1538(-)